MQFKFHAPMDKFTAIFFYPVWWIYITYFILKEKPEIVHACDFDTLIPVMILKQFTNFKFVYTIFDFYANHIPDGRFVSISRPLKKFIRSIEILGINRCDLLTLVDYSRLEEVKGTTNKNIIYLFNSPEDQKITIEKRIRNSDKTLSIFYAGLLINMRGITDMITAISGLSDVQLTLVGPLPDSDVLNVIESHSANVQYIGWIPTYEEVLNRSNFADVLFRFSDPKYPSTKYASPVKLFEAMMLGKPIIVSDDSSMANIVRENNCGLVVSFGDIKAIRESVVRMMNDPISREELGKNGRKAYEEKYNWMIMEDRLVKAYENLGT